MKNKLLFVLAGMLFASFQSFAQCQTPSGLGVTVVDGTTTMLTWNVANGADSYKVNVQEGSGNPVTFQFNVTVATTSYTIGGLTEGANYKFKVRSLCGGNNSNWSDFFNFTPGTGPTPTTCDIPTGLTASNITTSSATLNWNAMTNATKYKINVQNAQGNNNLFALNATPSNNTYTVTGLLSGENYKFKVRSICGQGIKSNFSPFFTFTTAGQKLSDNILAYDVNIYPNPATDQITVQLGAFTSAVTIRLIDQLGRIVYETVTNGDEPAHIISVSQMQSGVYILMVNSGNDVVNKKVQIAR